MNNTKYYFTNNFSLYALSYFLREVNRRVDTKTDKTTTCPIPFTCIIKIFNYFKMSIP